MLRGRRSFKLPHPAGVPDDAGEKSASRKFAGIGPANAFLLRDFWFVAHPEASMPPVAGTPGSTFFDVCRAFFPTDLVGCSKPLGHAR